MAFVPVPKDLSKVKTKVAFNLTKRQLICFASVRLSGRAEFRVRGWRLYHRQARDAHLR